MHLFHRCGGLVIVKLIAMINDKMGRQWSELKEGTLCKFLLSVNKNIQREAIH